MPNTFTLIASSTVGSGGASSIDFTSISSAYTDLCVKLSLRTNNAFQGDDVTMKINSSATGYTNRTLLGNGSAASSINNTSSVQMYIGPTSAGASSGSNVFANAEVYIPNYLSSANKSVSTDAVAEYNGTLVYMGLTASLWSNTAAITSLSFQSFGGSTIQQYSTAYLYGIVKS